MPFCLPHIIIITHIAYCARWDSKHFICINSFNPHNNPRSRLFLPISEVRKLRHREFTSSTKTTQWVTGLFTGSRVVHLTTTLPDLSCHVLPSKTRILSILSTVDCKNVPRYSPFSHPCPLQCDLAAYCIKRQKLLLLSLNLDWPWNLYWLINGKPWKMINGFQAQAARGLVCFLFFRTLPLSCDEVRLACWRMRDQGKGSPVAHLRPLRPVYISQGPNMWESPARSAELSPEAG